MYCVGLTGSIASGKSTVANYFKVLGVDVICSDTIAKALTVPSMPAFASIIEHFGPHLLTPSNTLDRAKLRQIIFNHSNERVWLEQLLHPLIRRDIEKKIQASSSPYCLIDIPLLTKKSDYPYLNRLLLIKAGDGIQLERLIRRDNSSKEDALLILATQKKTTLKEALADDILDNTGSLAQLQKKVAALHKKYLSLTR